jgi:hypothetical protein
LTSNGEGIHDEDLRRKADLLVVGRGHDQGAISRIGRGFTRSCAIAVPGPRI